MKAIRWLTVPTLLAMVLATASVARSQSVSITSNSPTVQLNGTSTSSNSCAGEITNTPSHIIQVAEASNLRFSVQSNGEPTLLIRSSTGQKFCVQADDFSKGQVEIPGRWNKGTYSVYVGDRSGSQHPYTLSISGN